MLFKNGASCQDFIASVKDERIITDDLWNDNDRSNPKEKSCRSATLSTRNTIGQIVLSYKIRI